MSSVLLKDLNDFIGPSQACIKPTNTNAGTGLVTKKVDINLGDCLACSGCITSAETLLVQQQNQDELYNAINDSKTGSVGSKKHIAISLSLQAIASLAAKYSMGMQETAEKLSSFFVSLGCHKVYHINLARHISLVESIKEFVERYRANNLPVLASSCPGWVCYVEKTHGELIIPKLSHVKSPQQIMGTLLKDLARQPGLERQDIYHATIMPCFDKKLEASREQFFEPRTGTKDVDCVLTPIEVVSMLDLEGIDLRSMDSRKLDKIFSNCDVNDYNTDQLTSHIGSESGGYAENTLIASSSILSGLNVGTEGAMVKCKHTTLRNNDFIELCIDSSDSPDGVEMTPNSTQLKFAVVNGFRNIQTLVQRLKRKALKYDYIEVMACPSGCINGGAQLKIPSIAGDTNLVQNEAQTLYRQVPAITERIELNACKSLYNWLGLATNQTVAEQLYTSFRAVPKTENLSVNW